MERVFVDIKDAERAILNYIGSKNFEKAMSSLDMSNGRNSFIAGLGMAKTTFFFLSNSGSTQIYEGQFGEPITLCNNCLIDFEDFRYNHQSFNKQLTTEDDFEGKERCQIKF